MGELDPDEMLRKMGNKTFLKWWLCNKIEPFGEQRSDWRAAQIVAMVHNVAVKQQKGPKDFVLKFTQQEKYKRSPEEETRDLKLFISALAGVKVE